MPRCLSSHAFSSGLRKLVGPCGSTFARLGFKLFVSFRLGVWPGLGLRIPLKTALLPVLGAGPQVEAIEGLRFRFFGLSVRAELRARTGLLCTGGLGSCRSRTLRNCVSQLLDRDTSESRPCFAVADNSAFRTSALRMAKTSTRPSATTMQTSSSVTWTAPAKLATLQRISTQDASKRPTRRPENPSGASP